MKSLYLVPIIAALFAVGQLAIAEEIHGPWSGAITPTSAVVKASLTPPLILWINSVPWITPAPETTNTTGEMPNAKDFWGSYATERREIADFIKQNQIQGLCLLSGDAHMLAADDGTNSDFATAGGAPLPVMQAGPLDRPKSLKGGPYSQGTYHPTKGEGCYGLVTVDDQGQQIQVTFSGRNHLKEEKITLKFATPTNP